MGDQGLDAAQGVDGSLLTTDSGVNTNPRRYEKDYGFVSDVVAVAVGPVATPIWAAGLPAVNPAAGRTAGLVTTIYSLVIENSTGAAVTAWLEVAGAPITPPIHVANNDTVVVGFPAGLNVGDVDIDLNASAAGVEGQISGTEG